MRQESAKVSTGCLEVSLRGLSESEDAITKPSK